MTMKRRNWKRARPFAAFCLCVGTGAALIAWDVHRLGTPRVERVSDAPPAPVAIVLGAQGQVLIDRVAVGVALYRAGKVKKLLMTGDNHKAGYNEPEQMRRMAMAAGVPAKDIVLDYAGFRTYDSLYRARDIFGVRDALIVTQDFHLPRSLYLARKLGMHCVGVSADLHPSYPGQAWFHAREALATEAAWFDIKTRRPPKFLGKREPIFPG